MRGVRAGDFTLRSIPSGGFALDGGAMFGVAPKPMWEKSNPPDARNRIPLALRLLLIEGRGRSWLVDTGIGEKFGEKENEIYAVRAEMPDAALRRAGVDPAGITDVILTHLHFDHGGGSTRRDGSAVFPNARYYVQRRQLEWARRPTPKDRASFRPDDYEPLVREGRLRLVDGPAELEPGIEVIPVFGHTEALQLVRVSGGGTSLLYCADMVPTASHVRVPFVMAYDNHPLKTIEEKSELLGRAAREGWILFFEHDPVRAACRVVEGPRDFAAGEEVIL